LGNYGEKKDPIGSKAYLSTQNHVKNEHLAKYILKGKAAVVNWKEVSDSDFGLDGIVPVYGVAIKTAVGYSYKKMSTADLRLFPFFIEAGPLQKMLNQDADGARKYLKDEGNDARIVSYVWVVMEAELSEIFSQSGGFEAGVVSGLLDLSINKSKGGVTTITLEAGSIFAYGMHKVKKWDKEMIEEMEDDFKGMS